MQQLVKVLQDSRRHLNLKPSKWYLSKTLSWVYVDSRRVLPDPYNVKKIKEWPNAQNITEVWAILGMGDWYQRFIQGYSLIVKPLIHLNKNKVPSEWSEDCMQAFKTLKGALLGHDIIGYPILDTDARLNTIDTVLSMVEDSREKVTANGSRMLSIQEENCCRTDRELLDLCFFHGVL